MFCCTTGNFFVQNEDISCHIQFHITLIFFYVIQCFSSCVSSEFGVSCLILWCRERTSDFFVSLTNIVFICRFKHMTDVTSTCPDCHIISLILNSAVWCWATCKSAKFPHSRSALVCHPLLSIWEAAITLRFLSTQHQYFTSGKVWFPEPHISSPGVVRAQHRYEI